MVDAVNAKTVPRLAGSDDSKSLGKGIVLEPAKGFLWAVHFVTSERSTKMLLWKRRYSVVKSRADIIWKGVAVLDLH
jgi:hypothetical protein